MAKGSRSSKSKSKNSFVDNTQQQHAMNEYQSIDPNSANMPYMPPIAMQIDYPNGNLSLFNNDINTDQNEYKNGEHDVEETLDTGDDLNGAIRVVVRIRPPNAMELKNGFIQGVTCEADDRTLRLFGPDGSTRPLTFNRVYNTDIHQERFFESSGIKELISQALAGYSICIFAFGQTGSGKSFTISGPEGIQTAENAGVVPRALSHLFDQISSNSGSIAVKASYLEIYNECVYDLLNPNGGNLAVRWSAERGFFVENLFTLDCDILDDTLAILEEGLKNRTTASHRLNEYSSRSHSVMTIFLESHTVDPSDGRSIARHGKISFVDLAGSEKVKLSNAKGETLTETNNINKSLLTLGKCISALSDVKKRQGHIPYRDSKLTKLLADSLGGHGLALMIACVSPAMLNINETVKTLQYAKRAKKIKNKPVVNLDPREEMISMLKKEVLMLKKENQFIKDSISDDPRYQDLLIFIGQGKHLPGLESKRTIKDSNNSFQDSPTRPGSSGSIRSVRNGSITMNKNKSTRKSSFTPGFGRAKSMTDHGQYRSKRPPSEASSVESFISRGTVGRRSSSAHSVNYRKNSSNLPRIPTLKGNPKNSSKKVNINEISSFINPAENQYQETDKNYTSSSNEESLEDSPKPEIPKNVKKDRYVDLDNSIEKMNDLDIRRNSKNLSNSKEDLKSKKSLGKDKPSKEKDDKKNENRKDAGDKKKRSKEILKPSSQDSQESIAKIEMNSKAVKNIKKLKKKTMKEVIALDDEIERMQNE